MTVLYGSIEFTLLGIIILIDDFAAFCTPMAVGFGIGLLGHILAGERDKQAV